MDIVVRMAIPRDAIFLTSMVNSTRSEEGNHNQENTTFLMTKEYINENVVYIAQKKETIIGCCALRKVEKAKIVNGENNKYEYWLENLYVRPAYAGKGIGTKLVEQIMAYCKSRGISTFSVLSQPQTNGFYKKLGAEFVNQTSLESHNKEVNLIKSESPEIKEIKNAAAAGMSFEQPLFYKSSLEKKLSELDQDDEDDEDLYEEEIYEEEIYEEDELYADYEDDVDYEDEAFYEQAEYEEYDEYDDRYTDDDDDESVEAISHTQEKPIKENELDPELELKAKLESRLSYDEFVKAAVPIGYKFECEEEAMVLKKEASYEKMIDQFETEYAVAEEAIQYGYEEAKEPILKDMRDRLADNVIEVVAKTEKEKMLAGEMYIDWGDELAQDRQRARQLLQEFNHTNPENKKVTYTILKELFGKVGEYVYIEPYFNCRYGYNIEVGENLYVECNCVILDHGRVSIGDNCVISSQVGIYTSAYPMQASKRIAGYEYAKPVHIGNNVWIGGRAIINPGVTIGNNVVISPGTVVNTDIPDNVLVAGNPARIINQIKA